MTLFFIFTIYSFLLSIPEQASTLKILTFGNYFSVKIGSSTHQMSECDSGLIHLV